MKKILLPVIAMMMSLIAEAGAGIGIGLVLIDFDESTVIDFYSAPDNGLKPVKSISFYDDHVQQVWKIRNYEVNRSWLKPEAYNPLYDLLAFRCRSRKDGWMEVIVNNNSGTSYWLKESEVYQYIDWLTFLQQKKCISPAKTDIPILDSPEDDANAIKVNSKDCFGIKNMKDDWIEITLPAFNDEKSDGNSRKTGWIRWKNGDVLLIKYIVGT
jgi:hypothetical protein